MNIIKLLSSSPPIRMFEPLNEKYCREKRAMSSLWEFVVREGKLQISAHGKFNPVIDAHESKSHRNSIKVSM